MYSNRVSFIMYGSWVLVALAAKRGGGGGGDGGGDVKQEEQEEETEVALAVNDLMDGYGLRFHSPWLLRT
jgi:hypothetical protein